MPRLRLVLPLLALLAPSCATVRAASTPRPCARLEAGDVVTILADYDIKRVALPPFGDGSEMLGVTHFGRHEVLLNARFPGPAMRLTAIHELLHIRQHDEGLSNDEDVIRDCALAVYRRMYGGDLDLPPQLRPAPPVLPVPPLPDWR